MRIFQSAARHMRTYPWKSQSIPCALLMGSGDATAQILVEKRSIADIDWIRTSRFAVLGFFAVGPVLYKWYEFLENRFGKTGFKTVAKKVFFDQVVFAPSITALILCGLKVVEGEGVKGVKSTMREDFVDVLITTYKVYPILQVFNFWLVPLRGQVIVDQAATVVWNAYISWRTQTVKIRKEKIAQRNYPVENKD